jgi:arylesterase / paraoxonase
MRKWLGGLGIVAALAAAWVVRLYWLAGEFKRLEPHFAGECTTVTGATGAEDIVIDHRAGIAFVSATDRRAAKAGRPPHGAIYRYDLADPAHRLLNLTPDASPDFFPHGVSLHVGADGRATLLVVNHERGRNTIEVFGWDGTTLSHQKTLADPLLISPNDVHALDHERFFVTNDHANPPGWARTIEEYLQREISNVLYYDGARFREAVGGIGLPNGVNASPDGRTLYVASTITGSIRVFDLDPMHGTLTPKGRIEIGSGVDNIDVDDEGRLWVAAHPKLLTFVRYASDPTALAPSQVFRIEPATRHVTEVYLDLGARLSGASVGAFHDGRLLIGPVFDPRFLDCRLSPSP